MQNCLLLKTGRANIHGVLRECAHAADDLPKDLQPGDLLLIHEEATGRTTGPRVTHSMVCDAIEEDLSNLSDRVWGKHYRWLIRGRRLRKLTRPLPIGALGRASGKNYGQGAQRFVYVHQQDFIELLTAGAFDGEDVAV